MPFELASLPYDVDALAPHISRQTLETHYGTHHAGYLKKLNPLVAGTDHADKALLEIVRDTAGRPDAASLYNNAAQAWNHSFFWDSMRPAGGGEPAGSMLERIKTDFGSYADFRTTFKDTATGQFGSGWTWLVVRDGTLAITSSSNAVIPLDDGQTPLLTCDVWEHAYYLDYRADRAGFVESFLDKLLNWEFVESNLDSA